MFRRERFSVLATNGFDGHEAELDDVAYDDCEDEGDDGSRGIAEALAKRLNHGDGEQGSQSEEQAIGDEVPRALLSCRCCPMEIERMQETAEGEEDKE